MKHGTLFFLVLGLALTLRAGTGVPAQERPVYFTCFDAPVRPDRYLRNLHDMETMEVVKNPSGQGGRVLKMQLRFTEQYRRGTLFLDLAPVRLSRFRVRLWNPNPAENPVLVRAALGSSEGGTWFMRGWTAQPAGKPQCAEPLPSSEKAGWITYEGRIPDDAASKSGKTDNPESAAFTHLYLVFEPSGKAKPNPVPLVLYLDAVECY